MRDPVTDRYRSEEDAGADMTADTVVYDYPAGTVRDTISRDWSTLEYGCIPSYYKNETWDVNQPGYHQARKRGDIVAHEYKNIKTRMSQNVFSFVSRKTVWDTYGQVVGDYESHYDNWPTEQIESGQLLAPTPDGINIDYYIDKAVTSLHAKLSSAPMQGLVTIGELNQTVRLTRSLIGRTASMLNFLQKAARSKQFRKKSLDTVIRTLDRGGFGKVSKGLSASKRTAKQLSTANRAVNRMSQQWLEYRYGIRQYYYDYSAAAKALRALGSKPRMRYTARESQSETVTDEISLTPWTGMTSCTGHRFASHNLQVTAGAIVRPRYSNMGYIQAFGLDEIFQSAWELTRFSFMVDWIINLGEKIAAFSPKCDIDILTSWVKVVSTVSKRGYTTYVPKTREYNVLYSIEGWDPDIFERSVTSVRLLNPTINPIPNWDIRLSVGKIADLLTILKTNTVLR